MNEISYIGEHRLPGIAGNFFIVLSFCAALYAMVMYYISTRHTGDINIVKKARIAYKVHAVSVLALTLTLVYILFNHLYEYKYAWEHLNNKMEMKYILSCLWEGQEGSFLLWMIWHAVLGWLVTKWSGTWEPWVMTIIALVQVFLSSMLLGVYFGEFQLGSNPFLLMREHPSNYGLPWTLNPEYLTQFPQFADGRGLNPLLQNYWMTIHPPTLFLGFAATLIPFAYAIAGMWRRDLTGWIRPAIPWAFFGVMILGTGILMGGAWAYEALGFGGFWAWDPVENASLVPWLTLVAAAHLLVVNRNKPTALFSAIFLTISSFLLVLYSTFLTRSGVLGDSSVHSFVDSGILPQLMVYLLFFVALSTSLLSPHKKLRIMYWAFSGVIFLVGTISLIVGAAEETTSPSAGLPGQDTIIPQLSIVFLLVSLVYIIYTYRRDFPKPEKEEALWSREFWMFIGTLIISVSAIHITIQTSVNVGNIFLAPFSGLFSSLHESTGWSFLKTMSEHNFAAPKESERFFVFHRVQIPLAFLIMLLVSFTQFLKYRNTEFKTFVRKLLLSFSVALILTFLMLLFSSLSEEQFPVIALVFATWFAIAANADYGFRILKGKLDHLGPSIAHIGFAMLLLGATISTSRQDIITRNQVGDVGKMSEDFKNNEDLLMYEGDTLALGDFFAVYRGKQKIEDRLHCKVDYLKKLPKSYKTGDRVLMVNQVWYCVEDHIASESFLADLEDSLWSTELMGEKHILKAKPWASGVAGDLMFSLSPSILMSPKGNSREPSIRHTFGEDLYTFLKYAEVEKPAADEEGFLQPREQNVKPGSQIISGDLLIVVDSLQAVEDSSKISYGLLPEDLAARTVIKLKKNGVEKKLEPLFILRGTSVVPHVVEDKEFGVKMMVRQILPEDGSLNLVIWEHRSVVKDFIVYHAIIFPQINVLWLGCLVMVIGTTMAIRHRIRQAKAKSAE